MEFVLFLFFLVVFIRDMVDYCWKVNFVNILNKELVEFDLIKIEYIYEDVEYVVGM